METTSSTGPCSLGGSCIKTVCFSQSFHAFKIFSQLLVFYYDASFYSNEDPLICMQAMLLLMKNEETAMFFFALGAKDFIDELQ